MDLKARIEQIAVPLLAPIDAFIVDIHVLPGDKRKIIQILADTDSGITIDQCAGLSRSLGEAIEVENALADPYVLEVSSPGLDRPLKSLRQYRKNLGRLFRVRYTVDGARTEIVATLLAVDGDILTFAGSKGESCVIPFHTIVESIEELPW